MNENYPCDIIQDLLPGYIDEILSETGTRVVKEHLEECEKCNHVYLEMKEGLNSEEELNETLALDGFKKVQQHTKKLKITIGIFAGLLTLLLLSIFLKVFVIGELLSSHEVNATNISYDEKTESLTISGTINLSSYHISRVVWEESKEEADVIHVLVYGAENLPFQQKKTDFTISIPNMKGKTAYLASPEYDRLEVYSWENDHYEKLAELEDEIYNRLPELDKDKDALSYISGIEYVNGIEGICYYVDTVVGENASYWRFNNQLITDGDFEPQNFAIWISLDKPYQILIYNLETGEYTEDYSIIRNN